MTFNTQFLIPSFNNSLRNLSRHSAIAKGFAEENLYFLLCVLTKYCQGKIAFTTFTLIFE